MSMLLLTTILFGVAAHIKLIPFELRWMAAFGMLYPIRKLFNMNVKSVGLVLREIDFHIPFWTNVIATYFASSSAGHEPGILLGLIAYASMVSIVLLGKSPITRPPYATASTLLVVTHHLYPAFAPSGDADLSPRAVEGKRSRAVSYILILVGSLLFFIPLAFGLVVNSENRLIDYEFLRNSGHLESISLSLRFVSYPLLFLLKVIWNTLRHPGRAIVVKFPLRRHCMR